MHNPKAEIVYDILAMRGGARLYSRPGFLVNTIMESDGPPTQGMQEVLAEQKRELDGYEAALKSLAGELTRLNNSARKENYPIIFYKER